MIAPEGLIFPVAQFDAVDTVAHDLISGFLKHIRIGVLGLCCLYCVVSLKIVELIAEIPGISFLNRMGGAGLGVVRAVLWIWIFFAVVYCFQATHWGNVCMKQIQGDMALAWIRENNPVLMLLKNVL